MKSLIDSSLDQIDKCTSTHEIETLRVSLLGKSGSITTMAQKIASLSPEEKKTFGSQVNLAKIQIQDAINSKKNFLEKKELDERLQLEQVDVTLPPIQRKIGMLHPLTRTFEEIFTILSQMGFSFVDGPDIENEYLNFTALNVPEHHPSRQDHDTFYMDSNPGKEGQWLLRTHTSPVQIRAMKDRGAPLKVFTIGRTYRSDSDATHTPMFHQIEGLWIDENINFGHLKGCIYDFCKRFFNVDGFPIRLRPSFFPFTEPSAEVDIGYRKIDGQLVIGYGTADDPHKWLEVLGCGMVHPEVLKAGGIDPDKYQGFAFGMGLNRFTSLKYGIPDLRGYFEGDQRWIDNYGFLPSRSVLGI